MGESGGMYQTMGMVRYSGCKAVPPCTSWPAHRPVSVVRPPASQPGCPAAEPRRSPGIIGIQDQVQLCRVQVLLVAGRRGRRHPIGVVEEQAEVAQPSDAGLRAHRRQPDLNPGVAQVHFSALPVL